MCNLLNEPVLLSAEFAACKPDRFVSLGQHPLKGIKEPQEIFALRAAE
jgi:class 3 adenylate cyclase